MDREALMKQLAELLEKDELKDKFEAVSSKEEMHALLRENGMNEDDKTLDALLEEVARFIGDDGELSEEDLEDVSGGSVRDTWNKVVKTVRNMIKKRQQIQENIMHFWGWNRR